LKKTIITPIKVRFGECDFYQHVNNTVYLTYMDVALADYLRHIWPDLLSLSLLLHKVHMTVDFKDSATFEDDLLVHSTLTALGTTSATFSHVITKKNGKEIVSAKAIYALMDAKTGQKCPVPKELKELL